MTPRALLLAVLLIVGAPFQLWAHPKLKRAIPSAGDTVHTTLTEVRLAFDEAVEAAVSTLVLLYPDGTRIGLQVQYGDPRIKTVLTAPLTQSLGPGPYTLEWKVAGGDGHPVRGRIGFVIAATRTPQTPSTETAGEPSTLPTAMVSTDAGPGVDTIPYILVRWFTFASLLVLIGVVGFRHLVMTLLRHRSEPAYLVVTNHSGRRLLVLGIGAVAVLLVSAGARLLTQAAAMRDPGEAVSSQAVATMLLQTVWGWGWLLQVGASLLGLLGFRLVCRGSTGGWIVVGAATVLLAFTPALSGHAVAAELWQPVPLISDGLHVLGAGGWLGTLFVLLLAGLPAVAQADQVQARSVLADLVNAFSTIALACASLVVLTGVFAAWIQVGTLPALWESGYGRTLLLKLAVLAGVVATGAYNWLIVRPALKAGPSTTTLRQSAILEILIAGAVLAITAVLVATSPPRGS